ncbi:MAG: hypothetical protein ABMA00_17925, partial [Gemmatimonas sp.]
TGRPGAGAADSPAAGPRGHPLARRQHGVEPRRPDINRSDARCTVEAVAPGGAVRIGLGYVRAVGPVDTVSRAYKAHVETTAGLPTSSPDLDARW